MVTSVILHYSLNNPCWQAHAHGSAKRGRRPPGPLRQRETYQNTATGSEYRKDLFLNSWLCFFLKEFKPQKGPSRPPVSRPKIVPYQNQREEKREQFLFSEQNQPCPVAPEAEVKESTDQRRKPVCALARLVSKYPTLGGSSRRVRDSWPALSTQSVCISKDGVRCWVGKHLQRSWVQFPAPTCQSWRPSLHFQEGCSYLLASTGTMHACGHRHTGNA